MDDAIVWHVAPLSGSRVDCPALSGSVTDSVEAYGAGNESDVCEEAVQVR